MVESVPKEDSEATDCSNGASVMVRSKVDFDENKPRRHHHLNLSVEGKTLHIQHQYRWSVL